MGETQNHPLQFSFSSSVKLDFPFQGDWRSGFCRSRPALRAWCSRWQFRRYLGVAKKPGVLPVFWSKAWPTIFP